MAFGLAILLEILAYPYSERNDELSTKTIADVGVQAALATKAAEKAKLEAGSFSARISEADAKAARANKDAAEANERAKKYEAGIANANTRAAEALKVAGYERLERSKSESKLAWRRIDERQRKQIAHDLLGHKGKLVRLGVIDTNRDVDQFVEDLTLTYRR